MTQNESILEHLRSGRTLTQLEAYHQFGCCHLPRRIKDLEELGHKIKRDTIAVHGTDGKTKHVTQYTYLKENWQPELIVEQNNQIRMSI